MKGTTWVQIIKAVLLIIGAATMTVMVLAKFGMNFSDILGSAQYGAQRRDGGPFHLPGSAPSRPLANLVDCESGDAASPCRVVKFTFGGAAGPRRIPQDTLFAGGE